MRGIENGVWDFLAVQQSEKAYQLHRLSRLDCGECSVKKTVPGCLPWRSDIAVA